MGGTFGHGFFNHLRQFQQRTISDQRLVVLLRPPFALRSVARRTLQFIDLLAAFLLGTVSHVCPTD